MTETLHHDQDSTPETGHPADDTRETRREFLEYAIAGTAAALTSSLSSDMATAQDHHAQEHHPDMGQLLAKQLAHPFNQNSEQWLDTHEKEWQECFDCSNNPVSEVTVLCIDERMMLEMKTQFGKRVLRVAGSGILWKNADEFVDAVVAYVTARLNGRPLSAIKVRISSHGDENGRGCGAAGIKYGSETNPDQCARDEQNNVIVAKLRERGIDAEFIGDKEMRQEPHDAIGAVVDCTGGRLQRLPGLNTFVIAMPDHIGYAVTEAMLALKISTGSHAYGDKLKQYTFVIFDDPARPEIARQIIASLKEQTQEYKAKGMDIRFATRQAPAVK
ncbi:MAG: hypothetical protein PHX87_01975 [Candidatus Peribacteraceae bacterium]|nr:hypothetical protein [Candidatus Peribacteraceae bacterium]MDD5742175.1 hypothetical protein [Candidatus Peribacteraceae bacterium]